MLSFSNDTMAQHALLRTCHVMYPTRKQQKKQKQKHLKTDASASFHPSLYTYDLNSGH